MVNLSFETWTEISMEEMFLEWQKILKKNSNDFVERHFGGLGHELSGYLNSPLAFSQGNHRIQLFTNIKGSFIIRVPCSNAIILRSQPSEVILSHYHLIRNVSSSHLAQFLEDTAAGVGKRKDKSNSLAIIYEVSTHNIIIIFF